MDKETQFDIKSYWRGRREFISASLRRHIKQDRCVVEQRRLESVLDDIDACLRALEHDYE